MGTAVLLAGAAAIFRAPLLLVGSGAALATLIFLNREFYGLLWRRGGTGLLLAGIPLHLLYHLLNGIAAVVGLGIHTLVGPPVPSAETWGLHELGIERSPPVPSPPRESTWYGRAHRPEG